MVHKEKDREKSKRKKEKAEAFRLEKSGTSERRKNHVHFRGDINEKMTYRSQRRKDRKAT